MSKKFLIALVLTVLVISIVFFGYSISRPSVNVGVDELLSAPEQIEIENRQYILESYLSRDFMPISPPDGKPLIALVTITAADSLEFPSSINADKLWVIKNPEEIWETAFTNEKLTPNYNYQLEKIARDGPKWGPNIQVDVVVRITHEGNTYLLKASNQTIHRTD